ncbi:MAG: lactate utilization protein C [Ornithinibacter sp.]
MSAREEVLESVRAALGAAPRPPVLVDRTYRDAPTAASREEVLALFVDRVEDYKATVTRCRSGDLGATIAAALAGTGRVAVPADLDLSIPASVPDHGLTKADLDGVDAVVTRAALGIAETGTVVLDHGTGQGRRVISLLPDRHVCVVRESDVVPGVTQAVAALDPARPQTWISGPSATSDIELSRVEGVHGPRQFHVVLVAE